MANYEHLLLLKQGVSQWNEWRRQHLHCPIDLVRADLRGMQLRWIDLRDADLRGADLSQASLQGADLRWANLTQANLTQTDLQGATLSFANLQAANLDQTKFRAADLRAAQLHAALLETADLTGAILSESDLSTADLLSLGLPGNNLMEAELVPPAEPEGRPDPAHVSDLTLEQFSLSEDLPPSDVPEQATYHQDETLHDGEHLALSTEANTLDDWIRSYDENTL